MLQAMHTIAFLLILLVYFTVSLALLYHWYKYTIYPKVFAVTSIVYLASTLPLIIVMALSLLSL